MKESSEKKAARIKLCAHAFSKSKLENSKSPNFIQCENKCGVEWGQLVQEANGKEIYIDLLP